MRPALVILAAGASRRLGRCKALVPLPSPDGGERTPIELLAEAGRDFDGAVPLVVTGADHEAIATSGVVERAGAEVLRNEGWASGRTGGLLLAARHRPGLDLCVSPVDVPLVPRRVFRALLDAWAARGAPGSGWLAPSHGSNFGHPLVLGRDLLRELGAVDPGTPLRALRSHGKPVFTVEVGSSEILDDLDTPADLERLRHDRTS